MEMTKLEIAKSVIEKFYRRYNVYGPVDNMNGYSRPVLVIVLHDGDGLLVWAKDYDLCHDRICVQGLSDEEFEQLKEWNDQFFYHTNEGEKSMTKLEQVKAAIAWQCIDNHGCKPGLLDDIGYPHDDDFIIVEENGVKVWLTSDYSVFIVSGLSEEEYDELEHWYCHAAMTAQKHLCEVFSSEKPGMDWYYKKYQEA